MPWRGERLPTPAFWPGEFHGLYSPWGCKESDTTERLFTFTSQRTLHLLLGPVSHCTPSKHCPSASPQLTRISQTGAYAAAPRFWLQPGDTLNLLGNGSQWRVHGPTYGIYLHTLSYCLRVQVPSSLNLYVAWDSPIWDTHRCSHGLNYWEPLRTE